MMDTAESHLQAGRVAQAIDVLRVELSQDPDNGALRGRVAAAYQRAGNIERAFHHYNKAAQLLIRSQDLAGAVRMLDAANSVSPNEPDILFRWAECLEQLGQWAQLKPLLRQLIDAADASGDRRRVWALDRLTALEPNNLEWAVARATALLEAGRTDEAVDAWRRLSPALSHCQQDWVSAIYTASRQVVARSDHACVLAQVLLANRYPREALALLVPFYDEYPEDLEILQTVLSALEAMQAWEKIRPARLELLAAHVKRRMRGPALESVAALLRSYPTDPQVLRDCARACHTFGLNKEASRLRFQLCQLHDRRGEHALRNQVLDELLQDDPNHEGAAQLAVSLLDETGRADDAPAPTQPAPALHQPAPAPTQPAPIRTRSMVRPPISDLQVPPTMNAVPPHRPNTSAPAVIPSAPADAEPTDPEPDAPRPVDTASLNVGRPAKAEDAGTVQGWHESSAVFIGDEDVIDEETDNGEDDVERTDGQLLAFSQATLMPGEEPPSFDDEATVVPDEPVYPMSSGPMEDAFTEPGEALSLERTAPDARRGLSALHMGGSLDPIPDFDGVEDLPTRVDVRTWSRAKS